MHFILSLTYSFSIALLQQIHVQSSCRNWVTWEETSPRKIVACLFITSCLRLYSSHLKNQKKKHKCKEADRQCKVQRSRNCFCGIHPSSRCQLSTRHAKGCYKECLPAAWYHVLLSRFSDLPDLHISLGENPEELGWEISESFPFASFISVALPLQQQ